MTASVSVYVGVAIRDGAWRDGWSQCPSNLTHIGLALLLYANDHEGRLPASLAEPLQKGDLTPDMLICESSHDTRASLGPTTQATLANISRPGHCSYVYLGQGMTSMGDSNTVLVYEPLANHGNHGMNVLFGDGHVEWMAAPGVLPWLTGSTTRPVVRPPSAP